MIKKYLVITVLRIIDEHRRKSGYKQNRNHKHPFNSRSYTIFPDG